MTDGTTANPQAPGPGPSYGAATEDLTVILTRKLRTVSTRLQLVVLAFVALTPAAVALNIATGSWAQLLNLPPDIPLDTSRISGAGLLAVVAAGSIKPAAFIVAFWNLYRLLGLYREGIIFAAATVTAVQRIGWSLVAIDLVAMAQAVITGPLLTIFQIAPGHISLRLEVAFLIVGLFVVLVARVMDLGRELKELGSLVI